MHCWPRYLLWLVIALLGTGQMLTACGQKGALYLPDPSPTPAENPAPGELPEVTADAEDAESDAAQGVETAR